MLPSRTVGSVYWRTQDLALPYMFSPGKQCGNEHVGKQRTDHLRATTATLIEVLLKQLHGELCIDNSLDDCHRLRWWFALRVLSMIPDLALDLFQPGKLLLQLFNTYSLSVEINRAGLVNLHLGDFCELLHCAPLLWFLTPVLRPSITTDPKEN